MRKFVVLGDVHLWPVLWQNLPEARNDAFIAAQQVFEYAVEHELPVVASGDIFNYGQKGGVASCMRFLQAWVPKLSAFCYIVGNHDITGYTSGVPNAQWMDTLNSYGSRPLRDCKYTAPDGVSLYGIDYCYGRAEFMEHLDAARNAKPDVLVIHQGLKEILGFDGAWEVECADLENIAGIVICGHTHVLCERTAGNTRVLSPGSTVPWRLDEELDKQFPVITVSEAPGAVPNVEWVPVAKRRPIEKAVIDTEKQKQKVLQIVAETKLDESLPEDIRKPIWRLRFQADDRFYSDLVRAAEGKIILDLMIDRVPKTLTGVETVDDKEEQVDDIAVATTKHTSPGRVRDAAIEIQRTRNVDGVIEKNLMEILEG